LLGNTLYLGRVKGASSSHPELYSIDISNPFVPHINGSLSLKNTVMAVHAVATSTYAALSDNSLVEVNTSDQNNLKITNTTLFETPLLSIDSEDNFLIGAEKNKIIIFNQ
jgi:hypothetical protein